MQTGIIYLIPTSLGDVDITRSLPDYNLKIISQLEVFIVEELRSARRFLRKCGYVKDFETVTFHILNEHTDFNDVSVFLAEALKGINIGLLSEAGCPAIADPGASIIKIAHEKRLKVVPLTGPSSITLALMASGLNGQHFTFHGYLPVKTNERKQRLKDLDRNLRNGSHTQIFIEAPYRNKQMIEAILENCSDSTQFCIASNITMPDEMIVTKTIKEWKRKIPDIGKNPTVFLIA